jgi:hypothetical protein
MKRRISAAALTAATITCLSVTAHATITDELTGPSDIEVRQSALTSTSQGGSSSPSFSSNTSNDVGGNSRFNASYYTASYVGSYWAGQTEAWEYISADATAFGSSQNILSSGAYGWTDGPAQTANVYNYMYAVGNQVRNGSRTGGNFVNTTYLSNFSQQLWTSGEQTFTILGIPIVAKADVSAGAYQTVQGHVWTDGITGARFNQGARLWVNARAGVGVSGFGGGVAVNNLSLMDASLPLVATARYWRFSPAPGACVQIFNYADNYSVALQELSGEVRLWAEVFWYYDDYKIASWPGFRQDYTIINTGSSQQYGGCDWPMTAAPNI